MCRVSQFAGDTTRSMTSEENPGCTKERDASPRQLTTVRNCFFLSKKKPHVYVDNSENAQPYPLPTVSFGRSENIFGPLATDKNHKKRPSRASCTLGEMKVTGTLKNPRAALSLNLLCCSFSPFTSFQSGTQNGPADGENSVGAAKEGMTTFISFERATTLFS